ncbi:Ketosteroid isomerase-related protein [Lentzea fradiae]|uniref:Ketosteroid isomerase-related protein n=1 Tax=Lentzea fradiae TaxID=200378 RepID=A0A1G8AWB1_9PSEU|nr:nuclear transport factor 2 family protein [Lentzea fradiae]SDH25259.1 Ketosteroid isomerase-related protein [Lentzea fradiae]
MLSTAERTFHALLDGVCRLHAGDDGQVDRLAALYAEPTDVRHPMAPLGDTPLVSREDLRQHFAAAGAGRLAGLRAEDVRVHATGDPEVFVGEFTYRGEPDWSVSNVIVFRLRDGLIAESRDYLDHLGLARATGGVDALAERLRA